MSSNKYEDVERRQRAIESRFKRLLNDLGFKEGDLVSEDELIERFQKMGDKFCMDDRDFAQHISAMLSCDFLKRFYRIET